MNKMQVIKELLESGVGMVISVPTNGGYSTQIVEDANDVLQYLENREAFYAKAHGCTLREYLLWEEDKYSAMCSATTSKGKPCRNTVTGGQDVPVRRWLELQGEYCWMHGGD